MGPLLALAGLSAGQALLGGIAERKQAKANLEAARLANVETWKNAGRAVNSVNLQRTIARGQTSSERFALRRQTSEALGMSNLSATASGTIGASTEAARWDIQRQLSEVDTAILQNHTIQELNLNSSLEDIMQQAKSAMRSSAKPASYGQVFTSAVLSGAISAGGAYAQSKFALS